DRRRQQQRQPEAHQNRPTHHPSHRYILHQKSVLFVNAQCFNIQCFNEDCVNFPKAHSSLSCMGLSCMGLSCMDDMSSQGGSAPLPTDCHSALNSACPMPS